MIPLTNEQKESRKNAKICYTCKNSSYISTLKIKTIAKLETILNLKVNTKVLHIVYAI